MREGTRTGPGGAEEARPDESPVQTRKEEEGAHSGHISGLETGPWGEMRRAYDEGWAESRDFSGISSAYNDRKIQGVPGLLGAWKEECLLGREDHSVGVFSPLRAQEERIREKARQKSWWRELRAEIGTSRATIGTIHRYQGDERDLFSGGCSRDEEVHREVGRDPRTAPECSDHASPGVSPSRRPPEPVYTGRRGSGGICELRLQPLARSGGRRLLVITGPL